MERLGPSRDDRLREHASTPLSAQHERRTRGQQSSRARLESGGGPSVSHEHIYEPRETRAIARIDIHRSQRIEREPPLDAACVTKLAQEQTRGIYPKFSTHLDGLGHCSAEPRELPC